MVGSPLPPLTECESYTDVYRRYGLLHERAYFAHCCHCGSDEQELLKLNKAGVAHCPSSNFMLGSGVLNVRRLLQKGIKVGLGTDVAGGYSTSVLDALRQAIIASRCVSFTEKDEAGKPYEALSLDEVFHLATQGGAEVLGLGAQVGNFEPGKYFDALIVDPNTDDSPLDIFDGEHLANAFEKYLFLGDDRSISAIFVGGRRVL
jgi:guanine deaminase